MKTILNIGLIGSAYLYLLDLPVQDIPSFFATLVVGIGIGVINKRSD